MNTNLHKYFTRRFFLIAIEPKCQETLGRAGGEGVLALRILFFCEQGFTCALMRVPGNCEVIEAFSEWFTGSVGNAPILPYLECLCPVQVARKMQCYHTPP